MDLEEQIIKTTTRYIKTFAMDLVVIIVAGAYVLYQMVTLEPTELNPLILIAQAVMGIICGVVIKQALGENGFSRGYNSDTWKDEEEKYNDACNTTIDYVERLDNFYIAQEIERKEVYRRRMLQSVRLKYHNWFDEEGNYCGKEEDYKLTKSQKRMLKKCIRVKIYPLNLFSEYSNTIEQDTKREMTDKKQRAKNMTKNTLSASLIAVIGVYFIPLFNWNVASLIASTMQVALWVLFGILQLYTNYNFIIQDKVAIMRRKKELIIKFTKDCQKGMYIKSPYDRSI